MTADPGRTVAQALDYARRGWPVFPCQPGAKEPATRHGFHDATTDPSQIATWWSSRPDANLAIATGLPGPDVLDIDQHGQAGNGYSALRRLRREGLLDGAGAVVATPSGGLHAYFTGSDQPSARLPHQHLDLRAHGGYVLAPPSHIGDRPYQLLRRQAPSSGLDWAAVTSLLEPGRSQLTWPRTAEPADIARLAAWVERLEQGNRNSGLYWAACRAVESGQHNLLDHLAAAAANTGLTHREITRTITSARRGTQHAAERQDEREAAR